MSDDAPQIDKQENLFEHAPLPGQERLPAEPAVKAAEFPVWTDNKAKFIMSYLRYFVLLTKHGTYIDGFAGPQGECVSVAAKKGTSLAVEKEPVVGLRSGLA